MDPQVMRDRICDLFQEKLGCNAKRLEVSLYNWTIDYAKKHGINRNWSNTHFRNCYLHKALSVLTNVDPESYVKNDYLQEKVLNGTIATDRLPELLPQQLFPEIWKPHIHNLKLKEEKSLKPEALPTTNRFTCPRCHHNSCVYHIMQIRSGDEGSTIFVKCNDCRHSWRINS